MGDRKDISEEVLEDEYELHAWFLLQRAMGRSHQQEIKIEDEEICPRVIGEC